MVGETPGEFVRRIRLERAAWTLARGETSVQAAAFDAGFESHEAFSRAFRLAYDWPPSQFRAAAVSLVHLDAPCGVHYDPNGVVPLFIPRDTGGKNMNVEIVQMPTLRVATLAHQGAYNKISQAFERLGGIAGQAGLFAQPGMMMLAWYLDDPETTPEEELRSAAAITLPEGMAAPEGLAEATLPAGEYARTTYVGPYTGLGEVWDRFLGEWLPNSGRQAAPEVYYEIYRNSPMDTPQEQLKTDLYMKLV